MRASTALRLWMMVLAVGAAAKSSAQQNEPAPLAGPEVKQVRPDRLEQGLTAGTMPGMQMGQARQLPMGDVRRLLEAMASEAAARDVRVSAEQNAAIRALTRTHQAAVRAFRAEHAERIESLRLAGGLAPMRTPDNELSDAQRGKRAELQALLRGGPNDADLQARVFAALTDAQREHLNAEIDRLIEERARERMERQYADELNAKPVDPAAFFNDDGTVNLDALPERLRRQLADLDEPQRANRLRRMLERLSRMQPGAAAPGGAVRAKDRRPPALETVQVPDPE